jgi:hypothetical protein
MPSGTSACSGLWPHEDRGLVDRQPDRRSWTCHRRPPGSTCQLHAGLDAAPPARRILLAKRMRWRRDRSWTTSIDPDFVPRVRVISLYTGSARGNDRDLCRRARPGDLPQLPTSTGWTPDSHWVKALLGLRPRAGEDLDVRGAEGPRRADGHPDRPPPCNSVGYQRFLSTVEAVNPSGGELR